MTVKRFAQAVFGVASLLATSALIVAGLANVNHNALAASQRARDESLRLAEELRRSSDDLTRFARTYVATGDPKYERFYSEVLAIRNGEKPRPQRYDRIYWDFVADGRAEREDDRRVPLRQLMQESGFSEPELAALGAAQTQSDSLVRTERIAMHAMKGEFADDSGGFTKRAAPDRALANRLMNDSAYHHQKARIMGPIDAFLTMVDGRTASAVDTFTRRSKVYWLAIQTLTAMLVGLLAISYVLARRRVFEPVAALRLQTTAVAGDLSRLVDVARRNAAGDRQPVFMTSSAPLNSTTRDEVGDLSRTYDAMIAELQSAGASIAQLTTELRVARVAAESASRAKGTFLAHMSHEIRTPLNAVLGYAQLLKTDDTLDAEQRRKVAAIYKSGDHLLGLLNDVLDMSRIEAGRMTLSVEAFDLRELLDSVQSMFTELASQRGLYFQLQNAPDLPRGVQTDAGKVRQVLINLIGNAIKFTDSGAITVRVHSRDADADHCEVSMEVEDTGRGIPAELHETIFTAFSQAEPGKQDGGTGLGLTISRSIARLLGGDLVVRSNVGGGSTFTFTFKAPRIADAPRRGRRATGRRLDPAETRRRALVVDDVASNRELLEESLSRAGFETRSAASGEEAIAIHGAWSPDLVLMDLHMPGMGGMSAIRFLRDAHASAPIIVTTAGADDSTADAVAKAGAAGFLRKPYHEHELFDTIAKALNVTFVDTKPRDSRPEQPVDDAVSINVRDIPPELVAELCEAARQSRAPRLLQLADRVAEHSDAAAHAIRELADGFQYRTLLHELGGDNDGR